MAEAAQLWAVRVGDPGFDDWDGFTAWLEADPAHLAAYESALAADAWARQVLATKPQADAHDEFVNDPPAGGKRWWGLGGAIAACLALVGAWAVYGPQGGQTIVVPAGQQQTIALADGSRVVLNGGTKIVFDDDDPRRAELANGEALFEIRHNPAHPFTIAYGKTRLIDAGTTFNVLGDNGALEVKVAQGAVLYRLGVRQIRLAAGQGLTRAGADAEPVMIKAAPGTVGNWQDGLLQYDDAPLARIAGDLGRNLGVKITLGDGAEQVHFTGTLVTTGTQAEVFDRAGALMGVRFEQQGDGWRVTPTHDASR
jgi:transmembrane sensor